MYCGVHHCERVKSSKRITYNRQGKTERQEQWEAEHILQTSLDRAEPNTDLMVPVFSDDSTSVHVEEPHDGAFTHAGNGMAILWL